jgi:anti-anti-sigma factor
MAFSSNLAINGDKATITLVGELDASVAQAFRDDVERAAQAHVQKLVINMTDLTYMSSAGLRALIFAKQKMGNSVDISLANMHESVKETVQMTGFHNSVTILDAYDGDETQP